MYGVFSLLHLIAAAAAADVAAAADAAAAAADALQVYSWYGIVPPFTADSDPPGLRWEGGHVGTAARQEQGKA